MDAGDQVRPITDNEQDDTVDREEVAASAKRAEQAATLPSQGGEQVLQHVGEREEHECGEASSKVGGREEKMDLVIKNFIEAHSTMETCLRSVPEQIKLCGLWKGLVVSFDTMFDIAQRYANSVGEELSCRQDRTGGPHQQIVCAYLGKPQRRVREEDKQRRRPCKRTNCTWRALYKVLNFNEVKTSNRDATPKELRKQYICKITRWDREHRGHIPVRLLSMDVVQIMRHGAEIARVYGKDIALCYTSGVKIAQINRMLQQKYGANVEPKGIHNALKVLFPPLEHDAQNLVNKITECIRDGSLAPESGYGQDDEYGILNYAFFVTNRKKKIARQMTDVVLFDTTCKVTRYDFALAVFTGIDPEYRSRWLASALIMDESEASFIRVFHDFCSVFGEVKLLMTDDAHAIESAASKTPTIHAHGLCGWHIAKNLSKKVKPKISSDVKEQLVRDYFLLSRCGKEETFRATRLEFLGKYTPESERGNEGPVVSYIKELLFRKYSKWAAFFFAEKKILTLGVESTQRAETMNRIIKKNTQPTLPLETLVDAMIKIDEKERDDAVRLETLYISESHLVASRKDANLVQQLSSGGFGEERILKKLVKNYSRWSLSYALGQVSKSPGLTASSEYSITQLLDVQQPDGTKRDLILCTVSVTRAGLPRSVQTDQTLNALSARLMHQSLPIVELYGEPADHNELFDHPLGLSSSELECRHRYNELVSAAKQIAAFSSSDLSVHNMMLFGFQKILADRYFFQGMENTRAQTPPRPAPLSRAIVDGWKNMCASSGQHVGAKDQAPSPRSSNAEQLRLEGTIENRGGTTPPVRAKRSSVTQAQLLEPAHRSTVPRGSIQKQLRERAKPATAMAGRSKAQGLKETELSVVGPHGIPAQVRQRAEPANISTCSAQMRAPEISKLATVLPNTKQARVPQKASGSREVTTEKTRGVENSPEAHHDNVSEETILPYAQPLRHPGHACSEETPSEEAPKNPPPRRVRGPSKNSHRQTHKMKRGGRREFGAPLRVRNIQNQHLSQPFASDDGTEILRTFLETIHLTAYGENLKFLFYKEQTFWPCLVQILGGKCTSTRAARGKCPFKGLNGMKRHMRVVHNKELVEFAKEYLSILQNSSTSSSSTKDSCEGNEEWFIKDQKSNRDDDGQGSQEGGNKSKKEKEHEEGEVDMEKKRKSRVQDSEELTLEEEENQWLRTDSGSEPSMFKRKRRAKRKRLRKAAEKVRLRRERMQQDNCSSSERDARLNMGYYDESPSYWNTDDSQKGETQGKQAVQPPP